MSVYIVYVEIESGTKIYVVTADSEQEAVDYLLEKRPSNKEVALSIETTHVRNGVYYVGKESKS